MLAQEIPVIPIPANAPAWVAPVVTLLGMLLFSSGVLASVKAWMNAKVEAAKDEARAAKARADAAERGLNAVVQGVEKFAGPGDHPVKDAINFAAEAAGIAPELDAAVQKATSLAMPIPKFDEDKTPRTGSA